MNQKFSAILRGVGLGILVASLLFGVYFFIQKQNPLSFLNSQKPLTVYGEIPAFQFTSQTGETVSLESLKGKVWVANFIFTRCGGPCPIMSGKLQKIHERWKGRNKIRFVSFSVDPEYDTPEVLAEYAMRFGANPGQWLFLTGDKDAIYKLSKQHFYLGAGENADGEQAAGHMIHHSSKFVLVDDQARIRGYFESHDPESLVQLEKNMKQLIR